MATIAGSIDRIVFRNPETGFCVARFHLTEGERLNGGVTTIVGTMPVIRPGEMLRLDGKWETHPVHGRNFRVDRFEGEMPDTPDGVERYLGSGVVKGIGPVTASRIVERFGAEAISVLDADPEQLRSVPGISAKRLEVIRRCWDEQRRVRTLAMFLQEHGVSVALAQRIYQRYGDEAVEAIQADPYRLAHEIHGVGFRTADAVATRLGTPRDSPSRFVAGLRYALARATEAGHVYLTRDALLESAAKVLDTAHPLEPALLDLVRRGDAVLEDNVVYLTPFHVAESGAAALLLRLMGTSSALMLRRGWDAEGAARRAAEQHGLQLAALQLLAVQRALTQKASILTGGPGTGKTSTLRTIITALEGAEVSFCLCAPTGRAAKRVAETTGRPASTIHRLLEFQPALGTFAYDAVRQLHYDFVIVDEVSMLDTLLFYHLLKAVSPDAHLLLVGDADQLPAVGPGRVLGDLLDSGRVPAVRLTELFRQAQDSQIVLAAHEVNTGKVPTVSQKTDGDFYFVSVADDDEAMRVVLRLVSERVPRKFGLDPIEEIQVVSPMHLGTVGVSRLNQELQGALNPSRPGLAESVRGDRRFRVGDKVMQIRNNYDKDVYNGDIGRIVRIEASESRVIVEHSSATGSVEVGYEANELDEIVLAYAVSVHKAQGSEFQCVVMPVTTSHYMMLRRNLLYTAITRARRLCVLVGSERALRIAVAEGRSERRNTMLAARLSSAGLTG